MTATEQICSSRLELTEDQRTIHFSDKCFGPTAAVEMGLAREIGDFQIPNGASIISFKLACLFLPDLCAAQPPSSAVAEGRHLRG
jgi:hypothetical protein